MSRPKASKNKQQPVPWPMNLKTPERIDLIANLIVEAIVKDTQADGPLLKKIEAENKKATSSS
jgi:hypothetical protein